ncbi:MULTISPECIES: hypothetical protein [unclassified Microbacterium]|uniref:hypothetical protein n=1 Tax=unclassified Microbacterium TaxID=2609290 RepID=UPI0011157FCF|nr:MULTISPECIES: hypothetical protein [unclassified Microbacterium]MXS74638.1 hypothetical protein [Microbacterium sp. TL13]
MPLVKGRILLYTALLTLPMAMAVTGFIFLVVGIKTVGAAGDMQTVLAPVLGGSALLLIAVATAVVVIRNERKQYREMMAGVARDEEPE